MSSAFNIPAGWREAIAEIRNGLNDATPSAFDNSGYRDYAGIVLDAVEEELSALAAAPPVDAVPGEPVALPHPGGAEISALLDSILAEYNWPTNTKNAARAGWTAAMRYLAASVASRAGSESVAWQIRRRDVQSKWQHFDGHEADRAVLVANGWEERPLYAIAPAAAAEPSELRKRLMQRIKLYGHDAEKYGLFEIPLDLLALIDAATPLAAAAAEPSEAWTRVMNAALTYRNIDPEAMDEQDAWAALVDAIGTITPDRERAASLVASEGRDGREHSPDDMTIPKPTGELQIGDYVFASRWGDGEPGDPWAVGWIEEIDLTPVTPFVTIKGSSRGWRRAMKITEEQGARICALYPPAESLSHQERLAARAEAFGVSSAGEAQS